MSLARQPQDDPPPRPRLRLVPSEAPASRWEREELEGSPARGVVWGVTLSLAGFWVPVAAIVYWLTSK